MNVGEDVLFGVIVFKVILLLIKQVVFEYDEVFEGEMFVVVYEYQDGCGFVWVVCDYFEGYEGLLKWENKEVWCVVSEVLGDLQKVWLIVVLLEQLVMVVFNLYVVQVRLELVLVFYLY